MSYYCLVVGNNELGRKNFINYMNNTIFNINVTFTDDLDINPQVVLMLYDDTELGDWTSNIVKNPTSKHLLVTFNEKHKNVPSVNNVPLQYVSYEDLATIEHLSRNISPIICSFCQRTIGISYEN